MEKLISIATIGLFTILLTAGTAFGRISADEAVDIAMKSEFVTKHFANTERLWGNRFRHTTYTVSPSRFNGLGYGVVVVLSYVDDWGYMTDRGQLFLLVDTESGRILHTAYKPL